MTVSTKSIFLSITMLTIFNCAYAQQYSSLTPLLDEEFNTTIMRVSDNGLWAVGCNSTEGDYHATLWDLTTNDKYYIAGQSQHAGAYDVTDDGSIIVGSCEEQPAYYQNGSWIYLPTPAGVTAGTVFSITPDGNTMCGRCFNDYSAGYECIWVNFQLVEVNTPDEDRMGENAYFNEMNAVSDDGNTFLGCLNYIVLPNRTAFLYDYSTEETLFFGSEIYVTSIGSESLSFFDALVMSPNGKYVGGAINYDNFPNTWDSWFAPFTYDVENDETTLFLENIESVVFALDNFGNIYGGNPLSFPQRSALIYLNNQWISMDSYIESHFGINVYQSTGYSCLGTVMSVSGDGKTIVGTCGSVSGVNTTNWVLKLSENIYGSVSDCNAPLNFSISANNTNTMHLSWDAPDESLELLYYLIYKNNSTRPYDTVMPNTLSYNDHIFESGNYCYHIKAAYEHDCISESTPTLCETVNIPYNAVVSGHVVDASSGIAIENATVKFENTNFYASTDENGFYSINVGEGIYQQISFSAFTFQTNYVNNYEIVDGNNTLDMQLSHINLLCNPIRELEVEVEDNNVNLSWTEPYQERKSSRSVILEEQFESGILPEGWSLIDGDGDGYNWDASAGHVGHNGGTCISSASYIDGAGSLSPDNWLITPSIEIGSSSILHYYVNAENKFFAGEHYGVYISTTGTSPRDFIYLFDESINAGEEKEQGQWFERSIELAGYSGNVYIAFRHQRIFELYSWINLDEVSVISEGGGDEVGAFLGYNVYRDDNIIASTISTNYYTDNEVLNGTHIYCITASYEECESSTRCIEATVLFGDGTLTGFISDADDNSPIQFATVTIGDNYQTLSDADGIYEIEVPVGIYTVNFNVDGYEPLIIESVFIDLGTNTLNASMIPIINKCNPPRGLSASLDKQDVTLTWFAPIQGNGSGDENQLTWSGAYNNNGVGTGDAANFDVAHKFESSDLEDYVGWRITKIAFVPHETTAIFSLRAWIGTIYNMVLDQSVAVDSGTWNEFDIENPIMIPPDQTIFIGYNCTSLSGYPCGVDAGPQISGKGNLINFYGYWDEMSNLSPSLTFNWCIVATVTDAKGNTKSIRLNDDSKKDNTGKLDITNNIGCNPISYSDIFGDEAGDFIGYQVYCNDHAISETINDLSFTDYNATDGLNSYYINAIYEFCDAPGTPINVDVLLYPCDIIPQDVTAKVNDKDIVISWKLPPEEKWISWGGDFFGNAIGMNTSADFDIAQRFEPTDLSKFDGHYLTTIGFVPNVDASECQYSVKVWAGGNAYYAGDLIVEQPILSPTIVTGTWNEVTLDLPIMIDATRELWIGIRCNTMSGYPAGCDNGPALAGKGCLLYFDGIWNDLPNLGENLNFNWCLKGLVSSYIADKQDELSFNIYRDDTQIANGITETTFIDDDLDIGTHCYRISTTCLNGEESELSNKACGEIMSLDEYGTTIKIYPNPAKDILIIEGLNMKTITLLNVVDQVVKNIQVVNGNYQDINTANLESGVYMLKIITNDNQIIARKIVITK